MQLVLPLICENIFLFCFKKKTREGRKRKVLTPRQRTGSVEEGEYENNKANRAQDMKEEGGRLAGEFVLIFSLMIVKMSHLSG